MPAFLLLPWVVKPALWAVSLLVGGTTVKRWWSRRRDDVERGIVGLFGITLIMVGALLAWKLRGLIR